MATRSGTRRLPADLALYRTSSARHRLENSFSASTLTMLGIGVMVGAGIFSLAGEQAAGVAGPAVIASFAIGAIVCGLAALCYAELSSTLPVSGSVYTYAYVTFGERWAWLAGWSLLLELVLAAAIVARFFVQYVLSTLDSAGVDVPGFVTEYGAADAPLNLFAPLFILFVSALIAYGTKLTGRTIATLVVAKVAILTTVIVIGSRYIDVENYRPFVLEAQPADGNSVFTALTGLGNSVFGWYGILTATGAVVFAYVGFDVIGTAAEETIDARRSVPRGILGSVAIVTVLYLAMAVVLVGIRPSDELGTSAPFVDAMLAAGAGQWIGVTVGVGASLGMATVVAVVLYGLSRLLFSMGRDQLLPAAIGHIRSGYGAPANAAFVGGVTTAVISIFPKSLEFGTLLVLCALFGFMSAAIGVMVLRRNEPDLERGFSIPGGALVPTLAAITIGWLALALPIDAWVQLAIWLAIGLFVYFAYGHWHSRIGSLQEVTPEPEATADVPPAVSPVVASKPPATDQEVAASYTFSWQTYEPTHRSEPPTPAEDLVADSGDESPEADVREFRQKQQGTGTA
jgi:basic amino acid/polyamine antiporter, APA family